MTTPTLLPDTTLSGVTQGSKIIAQLSPVGYAREIRRLRVNGPSGSSFDVYIGAINDSCRVSTTTRGDANSADFGNPLPIPAGLITYFVWSNYSTAITSTVTVGLSRA